MKNKIDTDDKTMKKQYGFWLLILLLILFKLSKHFELFNADVLSAFQKLLVILSALYLIHLQLNTIHQNLKRRKAFIKLALNSKHFLLNLLVVIFTVIWVIAGALLLFPHTDSALETAVWIPVLIAPVLLTRLEFVRKINLKAFDEREEILCLRAERIAGLTTAYSSIMLIFINNRVEPYFTYLLVMPFVIYYIAFNLASWWYFRVEEKELSEDGENREKNITGEN